VVTAYRVWYCCFRFVVMVGIPQKRPRSLHRRFLWITFLLAARLSNASPIALTGEDYARAERFAAYNTASLVSDTADLLTWLNGDQLAYRLKNINGDDFVVVNPISGARVPLFDRVRLAAALSGAAGQQYTPDRLLIKSLGLSDTGHIISLEIGSERWSCDLRDYRCSKIPSFCWDGVLSPDKRRVAFIRDYNLWILDIATNTERQLTIDGTQGFAYGTDNPGWAPSRKAVLTWSPDSRKIATFRADERGLRDMYLVKSEERELNLKTWRYSLPGDHAISTIRRVVIDVDGARVIEIQLPSDPYRQSGGQLWSMRSMDGGMADIQWSLDGRHLAFISTSRDHKVAQLRIADALTGAVRDVLQEHAETYYTSLDTYVDLSGPNWRYLPESNEVIWLSSEGNWFHLYLYDVRTGRLKHRITRGPWNVVGLLKVDEKKRCLYLLGIGREPGRNPYYTNLYRVGFDGRDLTLLTPENANHEVSISPSGDFFADTYSTPTTPPVTVLRDGRGALKTILARADISRLLARSWKPPLPFTVKARDGATDLYGLLFRPTSFDESKRYPIVNWVYPGPWVGSIDKWGFVPNNILLDSLGEPQEFAELGFIVVAINGMGTSGRSQSFRDISYGNLGDATLPDQLAGMRQLAQRYAWIDLDRAGIAGHSAGGYAAARALLLHPELFKVGIATSGYHDPTTWLGEWSEMYKGLPDEGAPPTTTDPESNSRLVNNLKGHLMLVHGTLDANVPPYQTLSLVETLVKANKDFDLVMLPNQAHNYAGPAKSYVRRRCWDYFVRYLMGVDPPHEFQFHDPVEDSP
jgi:dipeptidyl-peptidase-4